MLTLTSFESLNHSEESLRPVVRRPSTASGAARLHGSRSASILLETEPGGAASSQPVSRPSTATLPHLAKGAPSRDPTVVLLRQRNRQLEADIGAMEAHYRAQLQAYADSSRMFGFSRPPDKLVAYWAEAQLLLNRAIAEQYGGGRDSDAEPGSSQLAAHRLSQQLSAAELRAVRTRYEHQVEHARSELVHAKAELHKAHAELRAVSGALHGAQAELSAHKQRVQRASAMGSADRMQSCMQAEAEGAGRGGAAEVGGGGGGGGGVIVGTPSRRPGSALRPASGARDGARPGSASLLTSIPPGRTAPGTAPGMAPGTALGTAPGAAPVMRPETASCGAPGMAPDPEPMVPFLVHEAQLRELRHAHATELEGERAKMAVSALNCTANLNCLFDLPV